MQNVMMLEVVFITSCQVSEKWNTGPVRAHTMTVPTARRRANGLPTASVSRRDASLNRSRKEAGRRPVAGAMVRSDVAMLLGTGR
jgi:hypothetical protein